MTNETNKIDVLAILTALETIDAEWTDLSHQLGNLASGFEAVTDEADLEVAVKELVKVCEGSPYFWFLSEQAIGKTPPSPTQKLQFNPREIANQYHSLLVKLQTADQPKRDTDDKRTHP